MKKGVFPLRKTFSSILRAKLLMPMFVSAFLGFVLVLIMAGLFTTLWARFIHFSMPHADTVSTVLVGGVSGIAGWFMLPVFVVFIAGLFQDLIVRRVENAYYPDYASNGETRFWPDLVHDIRFTAKALALNILILPFYFMAVGPFLSILLNSYLLGREFFENAASYHMTKNKAASLAKKNRTAVYTGGFVITVFTLTPFVNIFAPVFALAYMVHVFHAVTDTGPRP